MTATQPGVIGLNHAVLYVRELARSIDFYRSTLDFVVVDEMPGKAAFLRAPGSTNHHDLGLFEAGRLAAPVRPAGLGLYHLAWQVADLHSLVAIADRLKRSGSLVGSSDHTVSKSLYARDPDGIEFEVMWLTPPETWPRDGAQTIRPLDLDRELATWT